MAAVEHEGAPLHPALVDISPQRNTLIEVPLDLWDVFHRNPLRALRDLGAVPSWAENPWDSDGHLRWDQASSRPHPHGEEGVWATDPTSGTRRRYYFSSAFTCAPGDANPRWIHVDLAASRDCCGMAMVHPKPIWIEYPTVLGGTERRPHVVVDLMLRIKAPPNGQISFEQVRERIYELKELRGFDIAGISYDGWQSIDSQQILSERGYHVEELSVDRTLEPYECLLDYMRTEGALDYYRYAPFLDEWQRLQLIDGKKVDHLPGQSKDVADAVAGAVYMAATKLVASGRLDFV